MQQDDVRPMVLKRISFDSLDDMYAAIGYGGLTATKAVGRVRDELTKASRNMTPKELLSSEQTAAAAPGANALRRHRRGYRLLSHQV